MSTETYEYEKINAKDKPIAEDFVYVYSEIEDGGFRKVSKTMLKVLLGVSTKLSELENDKEFITKTVLDLENYYLKSDTYSKDEIDNRISLIPRFDVQVVSSLPTTDISETTVYLVSSGDDSDNLYTEYINVNGLWEILGTQKIASVENAVLYTSQSLTDEEKTQARTNIGAISSEDIPKSLPANDVYSWAKEPKKPSYTASEVGALPDTTKIPTNTSDLDNDSGYITKAVNNLANYYLKSQTYSAEEIDNKISSIPKFSIEVVESLPTSNISTTTVYLLKSGEETDNLYTEYIRVNEKWEYLGKQTVDLTGYVKRTELSSYYTKTEIDSLLETIRNSIPTKLSQMTADETHRTVTDAEKQTWNNKLDEDKLPDAVDTALEEAKNSGVFDGKRGFSVLKITTSTTSSSGTGDNGVEIKYKAPLSNIKSEANVNEVFAGDAILRSYYLYQVVKVDDTYAYLSTYTSIRGTNGINGITPHIGDSGNWFIGETDTGVKAEGQDGSDASVTSENIKTALGYAPASETKVSQLEEQIADLDVVIVPNFWQEPVDNVITKVKEKQNTGGANCVCFGWCSDMHVHWPYPTDNNFAQNIGHISASVMNSCDIPLFLNCGDVLTNTVYTDVTYLPKAYNQAWSYLNVIGAERLMLIAGNHDGAWGKRVSDGKDYANNLNPNELWQYLYRPQSKDFRRVWGDNGKYFFIDNIPQKTRFICLNSHDGKWSENEDGSAVWNTMTGGYTQEQLDWLSDIALDVEDGWTIILSSHVPPTAKLPTNYSTIRGYAIIRGIVTAYSKKTSYKGTYAYDASKGEDSWANISIDKDFANSKGVIAGWFCGHCHRDAIIAGDLPFPIVTVTSAGNFSYDDTEADRVLGTANETAVDFVCIDKSTKTLYMIRLGAGNKAERSISYAQGYAIANNLTNVKNNNENVTATEGSNYVATLTPTLGEITSVTVTMGGVDITNSVYSNGVINIPEVTGDIVIMAEAHSSDPFALVSSNWSAMGSGGAVSVESDGVHITKATSNTRWVKCNNVFTRKAGTYNFSFKANGQTANNYVMAMVKCFDSNGNELKDKSVYVPNHGYSYNDVYGAFMMSTGYASYTFTLSEEVATFQFLFAPGSTITIGGEVIISDFNLVEP